MRAQLWCGDSVGSENRKCCVMLQKGLCGQCGWVLLVQGESALSGDPESVVCESAGMFVL